MASSAKQCPHCGDILDYADDVVEAQDHLQASEKVGKPTVSKTGTLEMEDLRLVGLGPACLLVALGLYVLRFLGLPDWVPDWGGEYTGFLMVVTFASGLFALVVGALFKGLPSSRYGRASEEVITTLLTLGVLIVPIIMTISEP